MTTTAEIERDKAIARTGNANAEWVWQLVAKIRAMTPGHAFTTDDLWRGMTDVPGEPRAMGAVTVIARRNGLIVADGYRKSEREECHARPVTVWRRV